MIKVSNQKLQAFEATMCFLQGQETAYLALSLIYENGLGVDKDTA